MFEDSMLADNLLGKSWGSRSRRNWTTLTSFGLQGMIIGLLLLIPLWKTVGLPAVRVLPTPLSLGVPHAAPPPMQGRRPVTVLSSLANNLLIAPPSVPRTVAMIRDDVPPPQMDFNTGPGVQGSTGRGSPDGILGIFSETAPRVVPAPALAPKPSVREFRTSRMLEGSLIRRVQPQYPIPARNARIEGAVQLAAVISKEGTIENLQALSGHPMLIGAAIDAVRQWRYRPYVLNGEPVEVETRITVNFVLSGN